VRDHPVTRIQQPSRHVPAHAAQPDDTHVHKHVSCVDLTPIGSTIGYKIGGPRCMRPGVLKHMGRGQARRAAVRRGDAVNAPTDADRHTGWGTSRS
jgi:hypothetical protein